MLVLEYDALDLPAAGAPGAQLEADDNEELKGKAAAPIAGRPLASSRPHVAAPIAGRPLGPPGPRAPPGQPPAPPSPPATAPQPPRPTAPPPPSPGRERVTARSPRARRGTGVTKCLCCCVGTWGAEITTSSLALFSRKAQPRDRLLRSLRA